MALNGFNYSISWSDFIGRSSRPSNVNEDAQIHPEMSFSNFKLAKKGKSVIITGLDINIALVKSDCWVLSSAQSSDLLKHEQGHYDILAISAREFHTSMVGLTAASTHELQKNVTKLQQDMLKRVAAVDSRYDAHTKHSRDTSVQQSWDKKIGAERQKPDGSINNLP